MHKIPYGRGEMSFEVPPGMRCDMAEPAPYPALPDLAVAVREALANPLGTGPLRSLVTPASKVCIVITDITRACPDEALVGPMLQELEAAGVPDGQITILVAVGMHRASTHEEKVEKLGQRIVARYNVVDHNAEDPGVLVDLGLTASGVPIIFNRIAYEADLLIATGIVEPHQYAGFSGCRKTMAVGVAGEAMISYTHGPVMLDHPATRLANLEGNPFHEAAMEIADKAGLDFCINVVKNGAQEICAVMAGEHRAVFEALVEVARKVYTVPVPHRYHAVLCGVGFPKDANLYQASRGPSYIFFAPTPLLEPGGVLVVAARCQEGAGEGTGEERFFATMKAAPDMQTILHDARTKGYKPGEQRAFVMAKVMEANDVVVVGAECPDVIRAAHMLAMDTMDEVLADVRRRFGANARVLLVPHSLQTLPYVEG
ncbi:MAG: nickel-dependent lactate racemase [Deltaproteobacteria bacterium]|nr:nickel-dependent lactate racemase [Deltaproteobacteria bacterium]